MVLYQVMLYCIKSYHILYNIIYISIKLYVLYIYIYYIILYVLYYMILYYIILYLYLAVGIRRKNEKNWNSTLDGIVHQLAVAGKISQK